MQTMRLNTDKAIARLLKFLSIEGITGQEASDRYGSSRDVA